jgi:hypothetical protein
MQPNNSLSGPIDFLHYVKKLEWVVLVGDDIVPAAFSTQMEAKIWASGYLIAWAGSEDAPYVQVLQRQRVRAYLVRRFGVPKELDEKKGNGVPFLSDEFFVASSVFMKAPTEYVSWNKVTRRALIDTLYKRIAKGKCVTTEIQRCWDSKRVSYAYVRAKLDETDETDETDMPALEPYTPIEEGPPEYCGLSRTLSSN